MRTQHCQHRATGLRSHGQDHKEGASPLLFGQACKFEAIKTNQQQQSLPAAVRGNISVMPEARSAQRRQQFVFAYGCASSERRNQSKPGASLWKRYIPLGASLQTQRQHCRPDGACLLFMLAQHSLHVTSGDCHLA